jgi:ATP adenylyltransferase
MENLWAPWRAEYIDTCGKPPKGCIFCARKKQKKDRENLILFRGKNVFVIMNKYPYNNGHLMVVPYHHTGDIRKLTRKENCELWETVILCRKVLEKAFCPHGYNIGMNLGRVAGAGIDTHCHAHIVPRWNGDTNFMPVFGKVKVISEELDKTYERLAGLFK